MLIWGSGASAQAQRSSSGRSAAGSPSAAVPRGRLRHCQCADGQRTKRGRSRGAASGLTGQRRQRGRSRWQKRAGDLLCCPLKLLAGQAEEEAGSRQRAEQERDSGCVCVCVWGGSFLSC